MDDHLHYMRMALDQAGLAYENDEVPVGAIVVHKNRVIAKAYNQNALLKDPTAHAELVAIASACSFLQTKYLDNCSLYVTLEPCLMCAGAILLARPAHVIYGASDPKKGYSILDGNMLHKKTLVTSGVLENECGKLLSTFFIEKRSQQTL